MGTPSVLLSGFAAILCLLPGSARGQAETGFPWCKEDGSMPDGYNQCECRKNLTYQGEFNDPPREFRVRLPNAVVGIGSCTPGGSFRIYLTRPNATELGGDFPWNSIWVAGTKSTREPFQKIIEGWKQSWNEDLKDGRVSDLQLGQPEQTSLASLSAIRMKATWIERDQGNLFSEMIVANNPEKNIVYEIGIISPANYWGKNHKLFEAVVDGFYYIPKEQNRGALMPADSH